MCGLLGYVYEKSCGFSFYIMLVLLQIADEFLSVLVEKGLWCFVKRFGP